MSTTPRLTAIALAVAATALAAPTERDATHPAVPLSGTPTHVLVIDADRDGATDLLVAVASGPRIVLLRGDGSGGFGPEAPLPDLPTNGGSRLLGLIPCDIDQDGDEDLLGAGAPPTLWLGEGDGTFVPRALAAATASHVATADLDRDGDADVLLVTSAGLVTLRNDGGGQLVELGAESLDAAWPVSDLRATTDEFGGTRVAVRGGPAALSLVWRGCADCSLEPADDDDAPDAAQRVEPIRSAALARADLDRDGLEDIVRAAADGGAALVVELGAAAAQITIGELPLQSGQLRHLDRAAGGGVRAVLRTRIPPAASGRPTRVTLGDPAGPWTLDLGEDRWTAETEDLDVWRDEVDEARIAIVVDRTRRTTRISASRLRLPVVPEADVEVTVEWDSVRAVHRAAWTPGRRGSLVYHAPRIETRSMITTPGAVSTDDARLRPGERSASGLVALTKVVDGRTVTLLRDLRSGATWRPSADGTWERVGADGRGAPTRTPERTTVDLHFRGPVDGSDEIRIDAAGALWTNRHWGMPRGSVALNGVDWTPRASATLANAGKTRFLPAGIDFGTAQLISHSGRDLLALDTAADHVTLKVSDSPNGPGIYSAVIRFETDGAAEPGNSLHHGLLAHLPLTKDTSDLAVPRRKIERGAVRIEGDAAVFDGKGVVTLPHLALADRPFAFSMWVRVDGDAKTMGLVEQRAANARGRHLHLMLRAGQRPYLGFYMNDLSADRPVPRDDRFHHLVFQYTGAEQEIWMDGERIAHRRSGPYRGKTGATRLGRNPGWNNVGRSHLVGALRDVRIYGRGLSKSEITALGK